MSSLLLCLLRLLGDISQSISLLLLLLLLSQEQLILLVFHNLQSARLGRGNHKAAIAIMVNLYIVVIVAFAPRVKELSHIVVQVMWLHGNCISYTNLVFVATN